MNVAFPFAIDNRGHTALSSEAQHIRQLIEQVLFTAPGERVMRPSFGSGVRELVFAPGNDAVAAAVQSTVQAALQQYLEDRVQVHAVSARFDDAVLEVSVRYSPQFEQEIQTLVLNQRL